jgi:hypothetical protein
MLTRFTIYWADGAVQGETIDWPETPSLAQIKDVVEPIVGGPLEHVRVLDPAADEYRDMFVDELGHMRLEGAKPRNDAATAIYRNNWLTHEGGEPDDLPWIAGDAIVFDRIVWS